MSEPPIDELLYRVETLERAKRRWKALALLSGGRLGFLLFLAVAASAVMSMRLMHERDRARQAMDKPSCRKRWPARPPSSNASRPNKA